MDNPKLKPTMTSALRISTESANRRITILPELNPLMASELRSSTESASSLITSLPELNPTMASTLRSNTEFTNRRITILPELNPLMTNALRSSTESASSLITSLPKLNPTMASTLRSNTESSIRINNIINSMITAPIFPNFETPDFSEINKEIQKEKREKRERDLKMIELQQESNELMRKLQSNTYNITGNVQQNYDNSTGTQIINQSGLDIDAIISLTKELKEIFIQLPPIEQAEGNEILDSFVEEIKKPIPKKSILKMFSKTIIEYLKNPVILLNTITTVSDKAPILIDKIQKLIN